MNIAELFVNLGITGADKTVGALGSVKKGLGDVASMSLEAKAAIIAALYGLERLTAASGAMGTGLTNFSALTGYSAEQLQKWQYAARQAGESSEELTGSLKAVQSSMTNMLLGKGAPEGLGIVARAVGFDPSRARDAFYVMGQLQKAAQALPKDIGNIALKSFGISEGTVAAMRRNAFNPGAFGKAPIYSEGEINSLNRANIGWSNLGNKIEMAIGHLNAAHGARLVNDISRIVDSVVKLTDAILKLANAMGIFSAISKILNMTAGSINNIADINSDKAKKQVEQMIEKNIQESQKQIDFKDTLFGHLLSQSPNSPVINSTTVNQNIVHHGDAKDTKAVKDTHRNAINQAYRQRSAQLQGG